MKSYRMTGVVIGLLFLTATMTFMAGHTLMPLAVLGAVGYPALLVGTVLDMLELQDLQQGVGLALVWPVGLFELMLPIWLFVKGFDTESMAGHRVGTS